MGRQHLDGLPSEWDVIVIGSGLGGLTAANSLAKCGHRVLLLEQHYQIGGLATWFRRKGGHIFDVSLHGFPFGMIKSCRKYWTKEIADSIVRVKNVSFMNPQFQLTTSFDLNDFRDKLTDLFGSGRRAVDRFFETIKSAHFYEDARVSTRELFQRFFPGRQDIFRLLLEPIAYANGSTLDDPALTYGIVFSNFMKKGVYVFKGGTDKLIKKMVTELERNGAVVRICADVERVMIEDGQVRGVRVNGRDYSSKVVVSNASLKGTMFNLVGEQYFEPTFLEEAKKVRLNHSSTQVYFGLKKDVRIPEIGDLVFYSTESDFSNDSLLSTDVKNCTFSIYHPEMREDHDRMAIVSSAGARYSDWLNLDELTYQKKKKELIDKTLVVLEKVVPGIRNKIEHIEAATPRTVESYTRHVEGSSFGTKYEGLKVSENLPEQIKGLFHAGSVGIIMSGWLGTINYGVIVADRVDRFLLGLRKDSKIRLV